MENWISVKDGVPMNEQWVFVSRICTSGQDVMLMAHQFDERNWRYGIPAFWPYGESKAIDDVTHWMPLPKPPATSDMAERGNG